MECVTLGLSDAKDAFIKGEVHSQEKLDQRRYRLIWVSSYVDVICQSLLHKADNVFHIRAYQLGAIDVTAIGLGHHDAGISRMAQAIKNQGLEHCITSDASAYDFSVPGELIRADAWRRSRNVPSDEVADLIETFGWLLSKHVVNNHGDVYEVLKDGVTASGQVSTSAQNTFARVVMAHFGGSVKNVAAGDDLVASPGFNPKELEKPGVRSRDVMEWKGEVSFTSHRICLTKEKAAFERVEKMVWGLYHRAHDEQRNAERFGGCLHVLRNTPGAVDELRDIADNFVPGYKDFIGYNETLLREFL